MTAATYKAIINEGIEDLSADVLAEIADFVLFVRRKSLRPQEFAQEVHQASLQTELKKLSRDSTAHLEEEWKDYEQLYPAE